MATCPNPDCREEFVPSPDKLWCNECGCSIAQPLGPSRSAENAVVAPSTDPMAVAGGVTGGVASGRTIGVGDGNTAGRDVVIQNTVQQQFCLIGGENIIGDRMFRCPSCNRGPLCDQHFDETRKQCELCVEKQNIACSLCGDRVPSDQTFTCTRCRRIAGNDHLDPDRGWCTECVDRWAGIVQAIEQDEVGIDDGGNVVTRDDVELKDRVLRTKDGRAVATIKENTWYARTRQWHQVKPNLARRERQAMHRFYPDFNMNTTPSGDLCWQGSVTTWTGNAYEILIQYPARFPFVPPRAFVLNPKIPKSRHIYEDGHLCLFHKDDKAWQQETTAATMMTWVSLWLHCFEVWQETGTWPRREADDFVITTNY